MAISLICCKSILLIKPQLLSVYQLFVAYLEAYLSSLDIVAVSREVVVVGLRMNRGRLKLQGRNSSSWWSWLSRSVGASDNSVTLILRQLLLWTAVAVDSSWRSAMTLAIIEAWQFLAMIRKIRIWIWIARAFRDPCRTLNNAIIVLRMIISHRELFKWNIFPRASTISWSASQYHSKSTSISTLLFYSGEINGLARRISLKRA